MTSQNSEIDIDVASPVGRRRRKERK